MPMQRRLPKRGFTPLMRKDYAIVNIGQLDVFESGSTVDAEALLNAGLISGVKDGIKVLADGDVTKSLVVKVHKYSAKAKEKIEAVGGKIEEITL
ncbi:ribosomal protein L15 [Geobacter metallireducens RCH3]|nr:ribosomal protein L15 [Geobacter metallireducens RCH3]